MNRKEILQKLEEEVSIIKDPELRKIAFEKLLTAQFNNKTKKQINSKKEKSLVETKINKAKVSENQYFYIKKVREDIQKISLSGKIKGLVLFKLCKKTWEKCLWALASAKILNIDGLNNHEIAYILLKRLYKPIRYSTVNNIKSKVSEGYVIFDHQEDVWKITPDGVDYIKKLHEKKVNGD